jgi:hypothetical protein
VSGIHGGGYRLLATEAEREGGRFALTEAGVTDGEPVTWRARTTSEDRRTLTIEDEGERSLPFWRVGNDDVRIYEPIVKAPKACPGIDRGNLKSLGEAIHTGSTTTHPVPDSHLPAAYTYFGQFIAHDLSRIRVETDGTSISLVTPALDLGSLFPAGTRDPASVALGPTTTSACDDLPRGPDGKPVNSDSRNDAILSLAQLHVAIAKFHRRLSGDARFVDPGRGALAARRYYQRAVLHDYLKKMVMETIWQDVVDHGPQIVPKGAPFLVPLEFTQLFQAGHGMIRESYVPWNEGKGIRHDGTIGDLILRTSHGEIDSTRPRLDDRWTIDWPRMLTGPAPLKARRIDLAPHYELATLRSTLVENPYQGPTVNLAVQTLIRGLELGMPSAQDLISTCNAVLTAPWQALPVLGPQDLASGGQITAGLSRYLAGDGQVFCRCSPLWFYASREAGLSVDQCAMFGPLVSRIVMETVWCAIAADPQGVISWCERTEEDARVEDTFGPPTLAAIVRAG